MTQHSTEAKTLPELKQLALEELGLTRNQVRQQGDLRSRSTWIKAIAQAYKDGKNSLVSVEQLPSQALALPDNSPKPEDLSDNVASDKRIELSVVPWLHDSKMLAEIEKFITWDCVKGLLIKPPDLEQLSQEEPDFYCYKDWMYPGKFVEVHSLGLCQVLSYDFYGFVYYVSAEDNQAHRQITSYFAEEAEPTPFTHQGAVEYLNKLYTNLSMGGITTINA